MFSFILSNGDRSQQRDEHDPTSYTHMLPKGSHKMIRLVSIHNFYAEEICGFSFFDKEGALLWKIGITDSSLKVETVLIAENEVIVGVKAKLAKGVQSLGMDFQFLIGTIYN